MTDRVYVHRRPTEGPTPDVPCSASVGDVVAVSGFEGRWVVGEVYTGRDLGYVRVRQDFERPEPDGPAGLSADVPTARIRRA
jgi:hypothetical protein